MKNILVIGLGQMGQHLCIEFARLGCEVMAMDLSEARVQAALPYVTNAQIADCTNPAVLQSVGVRDFDVCFVCIGGDFENSLVVTANLKELGATRVVSKAHQEVHERFLLRNGADAVVYPERDLAEKLAVCYSSEKIFDYMELAQDLAIFELATPDSWIGKTVKELNVRVRYGVNILGVKQADGMVKMVVSPDKPFRSQEHLLVAGKSDAILKIASR